MEQDSNRSYNCKDEELPVICGYAAFSMKRDLADFTAYSPKFNEEYLTGYETKIAEVSELVSPDAETTKLKQMRQQTITAIKKLTNLINQLNGYLDLAFDTIHQSAKDFGISKLRKGINNSDPEKVIAALNDINKNIITHKDALAAQGFSDTLQEQLTGAYTEISGLRQQHYKIWSGRKALIQNHVDSLNELHTQLKEILKIGKILYRNTDPVKRQEYTFSDLKKQVRRVQKEERDKQNSTEDKTQE